MNMVNKSIIGKKFQRAGDIGNILLLTSTAFISACLLYKWPKETWFDNNWLQNGFCVSNPESGWMNSHALCFFAGLVFSLIIALIYFTQLHNKPEQVKRRSIPPIQEALLRGSIMGVLGHGLGHGFLSLNPSGMDLRITSIRDPWVIATQLSNIVGFGSIFHATMPLSSNRKILISAFIASLGFTVLDVPPKMNFIYGQAVIYISSALNMLSLSEKNKDAASYCLYPYFQLPVLVVGILESTDCEALLEPIGGHLIFDSTIAIVAILSFFLSTYIEQHSATGNVVAINYGDGKKKK